MRIGVFGGTFDPPHLGHLILAQQALEQLRLDVVRFVPAGDPWRKAGQEIAPAQDRLAMTRLAVDGNPAFEVDDCEVVREGPSYTVDTLRLYRSRLASDDELFLIVGEDALADLPFWHEPAAIADLATIAVAPREEVELPLLPFSIDHVVRFKMPAIAISATDLRQRARDGLSLRYLVPDAVATYIEAHRLYQA